MSEFNKRQDQLLAQFSEIKSWEERYKKIIKIGKNLPELPAELYNKKYIVKGCQAQVWLHAELDDQGKMQLKGDSDALIVKGLVSLLLEMYSGLAPNEILTNPPDFVAKLGFQEYLSPSRANGFAAMIKQIVLYATVFQMQSS